MGRRSRDELEEIKARKYEMDQRICEREQQADDIECEAEARRVHEKATKKRNNTRGSSQLGGCVGGALIGAGLTIEAAGAGAIPGCLWGIMGGDMAADMSTAGKPEKAASQAASQCKARKRSQNKYCQDALGYEKEQADDLRQREMEERAARQRPPYRSDPSDRERNEPPAYLSGRKDNSDDHGKKKKKKGKSNRHGGLESGQRFAAADVDEIGAAPLPNMGQQRPRTEQLA